MAFRSIGGNQKVKGGGHGRRNTRDEERGHPHHQRNRRDEEHPEVILIIRGTQEMKSEVILIIRGTREMKSILRAAPLGRPLERLPCTTHSPGPCCRQNGLSQDLAAQSVPHGFRNNQQLVDWTQKPNSQVFQSTVEKTLHPASTQLLL
ncbi:unnamed protein product [Boreogadus saida]